MIPIETFEIDVYDIRRRARENPHRGAVTEGYDADRARVVEMLNDALATLLVASLRYRQHHYVARGLSAGPVRTALLVHADQAMGHVDKLARRIVELNGQPDFEPNTFVARSHVQYGGDGSLLEMIQQNLVSVRVTIETLRAMIGHLAGRDCTTRRVLESILAAEESHATDLADLLADQPQPQPQVTEERKLDANARHLSFDELDSVLEQQSSGPLRPPDWP